MNWKIATKKDNGLKKEGDYATLTSGVMEVNYIPNRKTLLLNEISSTI